MSGNMCAVYTCNNSYKNHLPGVTFHRFPKSIIMRNKWVLLCSRGDKFNSANSRICSEHFLKEDFKRDLRNELLGLPLKKELKEDVVPSRKILKMEPEKSQSAVNQEDENLLENEDVNSSQSSSLASTYEQPYKELLEKNRKLNSNLIKMQKKLENKNKKIKVLTDQKSEKKIKTQKKLK
ncbi:unnamed protein product [Ceutorhynchus assimilis]|uniref:THAP-type domain-containing protein n=1 Tax=Ceutorhynchus assimilis TaxID=467358 RepID=A0A9N9MJR5_9CUCU|nr:unnamed protein product [Ceutorhynchus assimilis]